MQAEEAKISARGEADALFAKLEAQARGTLPLTLSILVILTDAQES